MTEAAATAERESPRDALVGTPKDMNVPPGSTEEGPRAGQVHRVPSQGDPKP